MKDFVRILVLASFATIFNSSTIMAQVDSDANELLLQDVRLELISKGNALATTYELSATVMAGSNACMAGSTEVTFQKIRPTFNLVQNTTIVAVSKSLDHNFLCTMQFQPVYKRISTVISGTPSESKGYVLKNVGAFGHHINPLTLEPTSKVLTLTGAVKKQDKLAQKYSFYLVLDGAEGKAIPLDIATAGLQDRFQNPVSATVRGFYVFDAGTYALIEKFYGKRLPVQENDLGPSSLNARFIFRVTELVEAIQDLSR